MFYVYVIRSRKDNKLYTGATADLRKRLGEHNENKVTSTKNRGPFDLIYYEGCINMNDAFDRERYLKTGMGKRYLKNRMRRFLSLTGQVTVEMALAVIIILLFFVGAFNIWLDLSHRFVTDTTSYQQERLTAGQENTAIPIPGGSLQPVPQIGDPIVDIINQLEICTCIDDALQQQAVALYQQQLQLLNQIEAVNSTISGLQTALDSAQDSYNLIPWCFFCCRASVICNGGSITTCNAQGSLSNPCGSCNVPLASNCCWPDGVFSCTSIASNPAEQHNMARAQIQAQIDSINQQIADNQAQLADLQAQKSGIDAQINAIQPEIACCF